MNHPPTLQPSGHRPLLAGLGLTALLLAAPHLWSSGFGLGVLSQVVIASVACLSYHLLWSQGGMVSFGHAVYTGLGAYLAIHTLNAAADGSVPVPVSLIPLVGGLAGLALAAVLGWVSTRRGGTAFAMITLGIGELVWAVALMWPGVFGGEGGISANRVIGPPVLGVSFGPAIEVYHLLVVYALLCVAGVWAFTTTPLGRLLNAVRDNPERVAYLGHDPRTVRWFAFMIAGAVAGVAGGLSALHFEIVTAQALGSARSGAYLLFVFLGGVGSLAGPFLGGMLMVLGQVLLSAATPAWMLYLGLLFMAMVMAAPAGLAGVLGAAWQGARRPGGWRLWWARGLALGGTGAAALAGGVVLVEMTYHRQLQAALGSRWSLGAVSLDTAGADAWVGAGLLLLTGAGLFSLAWRCAPPDRRMASGPPARWMGAAHVR